MKNFIERIKDKRDQFIQKKIAQMVELTSKIAENEAKIVSNKIEFLTIYKVDIQIGFFRTNIKWTMREKPITREEAEKLYEVIPSKFFPL